MERPESMGLEILSLTKRYGDVVLLDDASLTVQPGEVVCLRGRNGVGKTTLLRCLAGLASWEGVALLDGEPLGERGQPRPNVGYVPQEPGFVDSANVEETYEFFARLRGIVPAPEPPFGLLPPGDALVGRLSGGQRQRLALAVGFLAGPRLLLLDEPIANLDDPGREIAFAMIDRARRDGAAVLIVSPAPEVTGVADRTVHLVDAAIVEETSAAARSFPPQEVA